MAVGVQKGQRQQVQLKSSSVRGKNEQFKTKWQYLQTLKKWNSYGMGEDFNQSLNVNLYTILCLRFRRLLAAECKYIRTIR